MVVCALATPVAIVRMLEGRASMVGVELAACRPTARSWRVGFIQLPLEEGKTRVLHDLRGLICESVNGVDVDDRCPYDRGSNALGGVLLFHRVDDDGVAGGWWPGEDG